MPVVRLVEKGWEGFTGEFAGITFDDGVSTQDWPEIFTDRVAAAIRAEDANTGEPLGIAHRLVSVRAIPMPRIAPLAQASDADVSQANVATTEAQTSPAPAPVKELTTEEIMAIADKDGIVGLREIAKPYGIKGRSINELLQAIVAHRASLKPAVADGAVENQPARESAAETPAA